MGSLVVNGTFLVDHIIIESVVLMTVVVPEIIIVIDQSAVLLTFPPGDWYDQTSMLCGYVLGVSCICQRLVQERASLSSFSRHQGLLEVTH